MNSKYFHWYWENPFKTYNKIKKYFLPLRPRISFGVYKGRNAKILDVSSLDLTWKSKWNSPRHEMNPQIRISIFNRFHILIDFTVKKYGSINDMAYWEAALWWLYYNKPLTNAVKYSTGWTDYDKETDTYKPIKFYILKEPYHSLYERKQLTKIMYENTSR